MLCKHEANSQKNSYEEARSQQNCTGELLKIYSLHREYLPLEKHLLGTASVCEKSFKRLTYKKLLLTVVKRNLLTHKKENKRKIKSAS